MNQIDQAILLYLGWKRSPFPTEDEVDIFREFGPDQGADLVEKVRSILNELSAVEPDWQKNDLVSASKIAVGKLKINHPDLSDAAASALEWTYSWWWK